MSDSPIRLSKPLYREEASEGGANDAPLTPAPRPARATVWARAAAVAVDLLFLHVLMLIVLRLSGGALVVLGASGPFVGLGVATAYLTMCNLFGRSLGRLLLRHEIITTGAVGLTVPVAFLRALAITGPLFLHQAARYGADALSTPGDFSVVPPSLAYGGLALAAAWYAANFAFAAFDTAGRTLYDLLLRTQVITSDSAPDDQAALLTAARTLPTLDLPPVGRILSGLAAAAPIALIMLFIISTKLNLDGNPELLARSISERQALHVAGFLPPFHRQPVPTNEAERLTTDTMGMQFDYVRRGRVTPEEILSDARASTAIDRATSVTVALWVSILDDQKRQLENAKNSAASEAAVNAVQQTIDRLREYRRLLTKVDFVQTVDLFFASDPRPVYSTSRTLELVNGELTTETLEMVIQRALGK